MLFILVGGVATHANVGTASPIQKLDLLRFEITAKVRAQSGRNKKNICFLLVAQCNFFLLLFIKTFYNQ